MAYISRAGLAGSIRTDVGQYAIQMAGCLAIVVLGLVLAADRPTLPTTTLSGYQWAVWGGLGLLSGPFLDAQQWQRLGLTQSPRAPLWAGAWFGAYMLSVGVAGVVLADTAPLLTAALLVVALAVGTSTIDSAAAALQQLTGARSMAAGLGVAAVLAWPLVADVGVLGIWTVYASARVFVVGGILLVAGAVSRGYIVLGRNPRASMPLPDRQD